MPCLADGSAAEAKWHEIRDFLSVDLPARHLPPRARLPLPKPRPLAGKPRQLNLGSLPRIGATGREACQEFRQVLLYDSLASGLELV